MVRAVSGVTPRTQAFVEAHVARWRSLFQDLVRERSVFEAEHGMVERVAAAVAALGVAVTRVPHESARLAALPTALPPFSTVPGRCSLVARIPGRGDGRSLALSTHLDVVPEGDASRWQHPPFAGVVDEGANVIHGRGAMDDKAGVTVALAVMETLVHAAPPLAGDVVFHFVLEDETTGNGTLLCLTDGHGADAAVIIDGTRPDRAIDRHAGQLQCTVDVSGRPASVSVSHLGVNAAELLARFLARIVDRVAALNGTREAPWTALPSPFQCVVQSLDAAAPALTVPDRATATCYLTFPRPATTGTMRELLSGEAVAFAQAHGLDRPPALTFDGFQAEPVTARAEELARVLGECAADAGFGPVTLAPSTGTSDLRHFVAAGIPCLLYGPGRGFNPHRHDEYYELADLPRMVMLFTQLASRWCAPASA